MKFKNLPKKDRPREKALKNGLKALSDAEIIALFLRTGNKDESVLVVAQKLLEKIRGVANLSSLKIKEIETIKGIGKVKALELMASFELVRRIKIIESEKIHWKISQPMDVFKIMEYDFEQVEIEHFFVLLLNQKNELIAKKQLYQGTQNQVLIDLRDIFEFALTSRARKMICVHNHPSGHSEPSKDDIFTTKEISKVAQKLNIVFIDHIIVGKKEFYSLILQKRFST